MFFLALTLSGSDIVYAVGMAAVQSGHQNRASKMNFYWCQRIFFMNFDLKMSVKMNLRIITKNHAADPEIGFLTKLILKPNGRASAIPTAWELKWKDHREKLGEKQFVYQFQARKSFSFKIMLK